jgi:hypothetical protein
MTVLYQRTAVFISSLVLQLRDKALKIKATGGTIDTKERIQKSEHSFAWVIDRARNSEHAVAAQDSKYAGHASAFSEIVSLSHVLVKQSSGAITWPQTCSVPLPY